MELKWEDFKVKIPELDFENTENIDAMTEYFGQKRAYESILMGLEIEQKTHNIFIAGPVNTGRRTFAKNILSRYSTNKKTPNDYIYVYNFKDSMKPKAISLKPGTAIKFKKELEETVEMAFNAIKKGIESEDFSQKRTKLEQEYLSERKKIWEELKKQVEKLNFKLQFTSDGAVTIPVYEGKELTDEEYDQLPEDVRNKYEEKTPQIRQLMEKTMVKITEIDKNYREQLRNLEKYWALFTISSIFENLIKEYNDNSDVVEYLNEIKNDISEKFPEILSDENLIKYYKKKYSINIIVDNSSISGAPVIEATDPTYSNLIGKIEYISQMGILKTDFTMIKPGLLHKANGGYLILDAEKVMKNPYVWEALKNALMNKEIKIENLEGKMGLSVVHTLEPDPIPLNVKVIMIGEEWMYEILYAYDPDFKKLFNIKVPFDTEIELSKKNAEYFSMFVKNIIKENDLKDFTKKAVEELIKYSCRLNGKNDKLSARFGILKNIILEANYISDRYSDTIPYVDGNAVKEAIQKHENMFSLYRDKIMESIKDGQLILETKGEKIGQINGLTVMEIDSYSFGVPVKITAKVFSAKQAGLLDIQRDADLSGKIHRKSTYIIENYFYSKYHLDEHMVFSASISFEQVYSMLEGDSASLAEVLALISAISNIPIKQNIAVTGSIDQHGNIQPVGGIIEKVEGFYNVCKLQGLTGEQGVIIPYQNIKNLVLNHEIENAIKDGKFHIYTVKNVDEAIEITMNKKAGKMDEHGNFEKDTVNCMVLEGIKNLKKLHPTKKRFWPWK
ncbi:Lon protease family protein [Marinitoga aeolica]|uniref:endopeptidase La n=1 Tax=Marinitoga aeolica TaxID=2809031 RepID=A0ABY8PTS4_9BACT|nr:ATP-binding protein [Marinitoga aeolica]WGS66017.1 AAA family ATPase [Marinitoga aeolica]